MVLDLPLEEQRHVVDDGQDQSDPGRQFCPPHAAEVATKRQADGDVAVDGHQQDDPDGQELAPEVSFKLATDQSESRIRSRDGPGTLALIGHARTIQMVAH